eukprot:TRINITY_DN7914_c0_g1_i1.p1 TRINITY_DN7914_c0_g1~~TRINITY_DN7914_c0_g1_i1.p1  ORF type:complete len:321 (-),score=134.76 TRINITY_DN7914_c0_g1_i1:2-919(-)
MGGKRGNQGGGKTDAKRKKIFNRLAAQGRGPFLNMKGILFSCDQNNEKRAIEEVYRLVEEFVDKIYPDIDEREKNEGSKGEEKEEEEEKELSIEESLALEIKGLKEAKKKPRFRACDTGCKGIVFLSINSKIIDPVHFVSEIFKDIEATQILKTRFVSKFIPIQKTQNATEENVLEIIRQLATPIFNQEGQPGKKYSVAYNRRNNTGMDKEYIVSKIGTLIHMKNYVDLTNPDWVIVVEIAKTNCFITITNQWKELHKFNIRMTIKETRDETNKQSQKSRQENEAKKQETKEDDKVESKEEPTKE